MPCLQLFDAASPGGGSGLAHDSNIAPQPLREDRLHLRGLGEDDVLIYKHICICIYVYMYMYMYVCNTYMYIYIHVFGLGV